MQRYFLELGYDGTAYHGWQIQKNATSVQEVINKVLSIFTSENIEVIGAGRTDTGVHAIQFYCHFDADLEKEDFGKMLFRLNAMLPADIAAYGIAKVNQQAHARFDATSRTYVYKIGKHKNPFHLNRSWLYPFALDIESMNKACELLLSHRNFSAFLKAGSDAKTDVCHISRAIWNENKEILEFTVTSDRFLRNMVRAIVGTCIDVGIGKISTEDFATVLRSGDRSKAGLSAPSHGLYLSRITYPYEINFLSHV
ncbi:MAG: tRNA pseudouridine(38-40) synthase TruA [Vicingaceae bacterium]